MRQLTGADAFMLYAESGGGAANNLACINIYDPSTAPGGVVTFDDVVRLFEERLHLARTFREKLVHVPFDIDHPYWVQDPNFDLEYHVREIALPKPGDWRQLCTQAARLHSRDFDFTKPPWELYMVTGLDALEGYPPGCFALIIRMHHTVVDGMAGMELLTVTHDLTPEIAKVEPPTEEYVGEANPPAAELLGRAFVRQATRPIRLTRAIVRAVPLLSAAVPRIRRKEFPLMPEALPRTRFSQPIVTPHRIFDGRTFDFEDWRLIKKAVPGATINDVGLTILGGSLRTYLDHHGELPEASLSAAVPISLRSKDSTATDGNDVGSMFTILGTDIEDPLERLHAVHAGTAASKLRKEAIGARTLTDISQQLPGRLIGIGLRALPELGRVFAQSPGMPLPITNVPGAPIPLYMGGAEMKAMFGMGPVLHGLGIIHVIATYNGIVHVSMTASREIVPDLPFYGDCVVSSFEALLAATT